MLEHRQNDGGQGELTVLSDSHHTRADLALIRRAHTKNWPTKPENREKIVNRMQEIVERRTVEVPRKDGEPFESVYHADVNAIKAASVLRQMTADDRGDEQHVERLSASPTGPVNQQVNQVINITVAPPRVLGQEAE